MAVSAPEIARIIAFLDQLANRLIGLQQAAEAEAEFNTLLQLGNAILDQVRQANVKLDQLVHRVAANQTQSAANALTLAHVSQQITGLPTATGSAVWDVVDNLSRVYPPPSYGLIMHWLDNFLVSAGEDWSFFTDLGTYYVLNLVVDWTGDVRQEPTSTPVWDWTQVLPSDDLLSFVTRLNPDFYTQWNNTPGSSVFLHPKSSTPGIVNYYTTMDDPMFQILKRQFLSGTITPGTAPVWPGLANVTLGTAVAIAPIEQTVTGPLDGVIVQITGGYDRLPHYKLGAIDSYKAMGTLTFTDDHGQAETFQMLGPVQAVYVPKTMVRAQTAEFRWMPGLTGTVTPWLRS